jgi:hypothetical protein
MKEEQPIFKVTDRRLFNPDGTPREIVREEETKTDAAAAEAKQSTPASEGRAAAPAGPGETKRERTEPSPDASPAQTTHDEASARGATEAADLGSERAGAAEQFPEDDYAESQIPGVDDPASFLNFLMSIASNAAAALGMMEHPVTGQRSVDPELAKHWIDVLGMLQQKTRGNLDPQEQQIFEGLLADLRMQYVSVSGLRQPKTPRGFTGSDITGGR